MSPELDLATIATAVLACPGVSALADRHRPDADSEMPGITSDERTIEIAIIAFYGHRVSEVVGQIETAVRPLVASRRLVVTVEDLDTRPRTT